MLGGGDDTRGEPGVEGTVVTVDGGMAKRYQPPVYVRATSWYSMSTGSFGSAESSEGACIQPTTHFSSSTTSAVGALGGGAVREICADCVGMRYCAYDHWESKYFGSGMNVVRGENVDCRLLERN